VPGALPRPSYYSTSVDELCQAYPSLLEYAGDQQRFISELTATLKRAGLKQFYIDEAVNLNTELLRCAVRVYALGTELQAAGVDLGEETKRPWAEQFRLPEGRAKDGPLQRLDRATDTWVEVASPAASIGGASPSK
jgi:hypothetical protein